MERERDSGANGNDLLQRSALSNSRISDAQFCDPPSVLSSDNFGASFPVICIESKPVTLCCTWVVHLSGFVVLVLDSVRILDFGAYSWP
jgi:hypothetical protein